MNATIGIRPWKLVTLLTVMLGTPIALSQSDSRDQQRIELDATTPEMVVLQCRGLVAPGSGDDTAERKWIHGAVVRATARPALREATLEGVRRFLAEGTAPVEVRHFLLEQLAVIATDDCSRWIADHLDTPELCSAATRALVQCGGKTARGHLHTALERVTDVPGRVAVIDGLGELGYDEVALTIQSELDHEDDRVRRAALRTLVKIGSTEAARHLGERMNDNNWLAQSEATALLLQLGRRIATDDRSAAGSLFRSVLQLRRRGPEYSHTRCAALSGLADTWGADALDDLLAALAGDDAEVRAVALRRTIDLEGPNVTDQLVSRIGKGTTAEQCAVIAILAARADRAARPGIFAALDHEEREVRIAALRAVPALADSICLEPLCDVFSGTTDPEERQAVRRALIGIDDSRLNVALGRKQQTATTELRVLLLDAIGGRWDRGIGNHEGSLRERYSLIKSVADALSSPQGSVRLAAIRALGARGDTVSGILVQHLEQAEDQELQATQRALVKTIRSAPAKWSATKWGQQPSKQLVLAALPVVAQLSRDDGFRFLSQRLFTDDSETVEAAYRALARWSNPKQAEVILTIAGRTSTPKHHRLAMRAFANLAGANPSDPIEVRLRLLERGFEVSREEEDRRMLLARVADLGTVEALPIIERAGRDPSLTGEVDAAKLRVAERLLPAGWQDTRTICEDLLASAADERIRERARALRQRTDRYDAITAWSVAGPFRSRDARGNETLSVPYAPERGEAVDWKAQPISIGDRYWMVDLLASLGGENCAGYLHTNLISSSDQSVVLELGSDDGLIVWVNEARVHSNPAYRGCQPAQDRVPVQLRKGSNRVVLKVANGGGGWGATLRLRHPDGSRVQNVLADATPPVKPMTLESPGSGPARKIERAAPATAPAEPKKSRKLLVFTLTRGFRHPSIPTGVSAMATLGKKTGAFEIVHSEDIASFEKSTLEQFDAICFLSTTGELFTHPQLDELEGAAREAAIARQKRLEQNLVDFVKSGKGLVGIHAATDTLYRLEAYGRMIGGYFDGHPWHERVGLTVEEPDHPLMLGFDRIDFDITDEIYQIKAPYSRFQQRVLMSLNKARTNMEKGGIRRQDGDFPISWVKRYGKGRVFYCSLGHRDEIFWNSPVLKHYLAGIQYALGDLKAPDEPRKKE